MLITSDLHLTDKKQDRYRFDVFRWLRLLSDDQTTSRRNELVVLGDLTEKKDHHSSLLVNKTVDAVNSLLSSFSNIFILQGNHDLVAEDAEAPPYFHFLNSVPYVQFISRVHVLTIRDNFQSIETPLNLNSQVLLLPHRRDFIRQWQAAINLIDEQKLALIFMHQTVHGSVSETGHTLDGIPPSLFAFEGLRCPVISGDVHVPQTVGGVTYVGSPHPMRFGDSFLPRVLSISRSEDQPDHFNIQSIFVPTIAKRKVTLHQMADLDALEVNARDQIKIVYVLKPSEFEEWPTYRNELRTWARSQRVDLHSIEFIMPDVSEDSPKAAEGDSGEAPTATPSTVLARYAAREKISDELLDYGRGFIS